MPTGSATKSTAETTPDPVDLPITARIQLLADALAAKETRMPRFVYSEIVDQAARVLFAKHKVSVADRYGKCTAAGYVVDESRDGMVRVSHRMPEPDLLDDDRMSDDEMAAERHEMVDAYAKSLEAAGWTVDRRGPRSRKPYLLASR